MRQKTALGPRRHSCETPTQLEDGTMYQDLGPNHFDRRSKEQQKNRLLKRLADLGYVVQLAPSPN